MDWFQKWLCRMEGEHDPMKSYKLVVDPGRWDAPWKKTIKIRAESATEAVVKAHDILTKQWFVDAWLYEGLTNEAVAQFGQPPKKAADMVTH